ncbi:hypothetical protein BO99DRAFT_428834 [Aspergillus violaceofuscus CBS 115571]|uniref:Uncharacterized protein n=1 Tax=Aspergillus violaceofuscus (strain CBS 115571) TaxID=1450538 RepID=A0A2V5I4V7_ASPV1|nr:hypothetical protein BO99DRAFT_428834 [Aspergillus violaceofuscus CBS 115571]
MRLQIKGFVIMDYAARFAEALPILIQALRDGKLKIDAESEHVVGGDVEEVLRIWMQLFCRREQREVDYKVSWVHMDHGRYNSQ